MKYEVNCPICGNRRPLEFEHQDSHRLIQAKAKCGTCLITICSHYFPDDYCNEGLPAVKREISALLSKRANSFYQAWHYLEDHDYFQIDDLSYFQESLCIEVVKVNPDTNEVDDDPSKNTDVRIWLEVGAPYEVDNGRILMEHDHSLDCGGKTFEEAIIRMADKLKNR